MKSYYLSILFAFVCVSLYSAEYTYTSSQQSSLKSKLNGGLSPGDIVYLADGTYTNFQATFKGEGTASKPITLKAKNPGKVILTGTLNLKISGNYLIVDGLILKDGMALSSDIIEFRSSSSALAYNCRLTNCVIDNCNNPDEKYVTSTDYSERWIMLYGKNNRVDHCYFTNKINGGVLMMVVIKDNNSINNNHVIDYNIFANRPKFAPGNNAETIRLGDSQTSQSSCKTIVENNVFYNCDGEVEIISIKSCDNTIRKNVFYESQGSVVCRHGNNNIIESNAFIGNNKDNCGGVRIINQGHKVYNNFFQDLQGTGSRSALCVMMGIFEKPTSSTDTEKEPLNAYHRVKDVEICYNTFVGCKNIDLGTDVNYTYPESNPYYPGKKITGTLTPECVISSNVFYNLSDSKVINRVSGNTPDITYSNNIYRFKNSVSINGFTSRTLNYQQINDGTGKGFYKLTNTDSNILAPYASNNFSYVSLDISGNTRNATKDIGAQQFENISKAFAIPNPSDCGASWYIPQQSDIDKIKSKTDFWENQSGIYDEIQTTDPVKITKLDNHLFQVTSPTIIEEIAILNMNGHILKKETIKDYSGTVCCRNFLSGLHFFRISTADGRSLSYKILL